MIPTLYPVYPVVVTEQGGAPIDGAMPGMYGGTVRVRRFACACGAAVRVADDEPLPAAWGVAMRRNRFGTPKYSYRCPACAGAALSNGEVIDA